MVHIPDVSCRWFTNIGEIVQSSVIRKTWNEGTMEYWWRREGLAWKRSACQVSQGDCLRTTQGSIIYIPTNHSGGAGKSSLATTQGAYLHVTPLFLSNSLCNVLLMRGSGRRREGLSWERRACKISQGDCLEPKQPDSWYIKYQTLLGKKKENWPTWDRSRQVILGYQTRLLSSCKTSLPLITHAPTRRSECLHI